jgi:hypothetical protein
VLGYLCQVCRKRSAACIDTHITISIWKPNVCRNFISLLLSRIDFHRRFWREGSTICKSLVAHLQKNSLFFYFCYSTKTETSDHFWRQQSKREREIERERRHCQENARWFGSMFKTFRLGIPQALQSKLRTACKVRGKKGR